MRDAWHRRSWSWWLAGALGVASVPTGAGANASELVGSRKHVFEHAEETYSLRASCASAGGRLTTIVSAWIVPQDARRLVLDLSSEGFASVSELASPPAEAGPVEYVYDCLWVVGGDLVVLVSTKSVPLGALWLAADLTMKHWTVLVPNFPGTHEAQAWDTLELRPGQFVTVGHGELHAFALRFDREAAGPRVFPWKEGAQRILTEVAATRDGFVACGIETETEADPQRAELHTVLAAFDSRGDVLATARLRGGPCALLGSNEGPIRLVHLAYGPPTILRALTFDRELSHWDSKDLHSGFFGFLFEAQAVELGQTLVAMNQFFHQPSLELIDPSGQVTIPIDRELGLSTRKLIGSDSRVFVVSELDRRDVVRTAIRVDVYTLIDTPPASSVETESPAPPQ